MKHWGYTHTMRTMKIWTVKGHLKTKNIERVVKKIFYFLLNDERIIKITDNPERFEQR